MAGVSAIFKSEDPENISNYTPTTVLLCFAKILEGIKNNRLYNYFTAQKILSPRQFWFQTGHSTEHAMTNLTNQIYESFRKIVLIEKSLSI